MLKFKDEKKFSKKTNKIIFFLIKTEQYLDMTIYFIQWEASLRSSLVNSKHFEIFSEFWFIRIKCCDVRLTAHRCFQTRRPWICAENFFPQRLNTWLKEFSVDQYINEILFCCGCAITTMVTYHISFWCLFGEKRMKWMEREPKQ